MSYEAEILILEEGVQEIKTRINTLESLNNPSNLEKEELLQWKLWGY